MKLNNQYIEGKYNENYNNIYQDSPLSDSSHVSSLWSESLLPSAK